MTNTENNIQQTILNPEFVNNIVTNNKPLFETSLLLVILNDYDFWNNYCRDILNISNNPKLISFQDFSKPVDNQIYKEINNFYKGFTTNTGIDGSRIKLNREFILSIFAASVKLNRITEQDFRMIEYRINEIFASKPESEADYVNSVKALVVEGYAIFLEQRRVAQISLVCGKRKDIDTTQFMEQLGTVVSLVDRIKEAGEYDPTRDLEGFSESMYLDLEEKTGDRIPISTLPILTKALGGGVLKGESGLMIATSGGGKTVFACQFAIGVALNGFKTLYITTEQLSSYLIPRMLSATANIAFNKIKDGWAKAIKAGNVTAEEIERAREVEEMVGNNLKFANWCKDGRKLETDLEALIKQKKQEWGGLDCIIVDWLGGGINIPPEDYDRRFGYYMCCVNNIKNLAIKHNVAFLILAQANKKKVDGRTKLDVDCIDGCNTLDQPLTWAAGISALTEGGKAKVNSLQETYLRKQCINIWKGRMNGAFAYPVYREFEFQRFVEKDTVELIGNVEQQSRKIDISHLESGGIDNSTVAEIGG